MKSLSQEAIARREAGTNFDENEEEETLNVFTELTELVEVNSASNLNLCFMGGMRSLIDVAIVHENNKVRKAACRVFN